MTTPVEVGAPLSTDEKLDLLMVQVAALTEEMAAQRAIREQVSDLVGELAPVTSGAMELATRELQDLQDDVTAEDIGRFARTVVRAMPTMEKLVAQLDSLQDLAQTVVPLGSGAMETLTGTLETLDEKGYGAFARGGAAIADKVVTSFTEDDVKALGDNVVLILNTLKEMTQPEIMTMLRRTMLTVQEVEETHVDPPSMFALVKSMRDPQTRRGLAKVLSMLHTVGEESPALIAATSTSAVPVGGPTTTPTE